MAELKQIKATGTIWSVEIFDDNCDLDSIQAFTENYLKTFEQNYSRFIDDSLLSLLNKSGVFRNPSIEFKDILIRSIKYYKETNGVFNIAIGAKMVASGYDKDYSFKETDISKTPDLTDVLFLEDKEIVLKGSQLDLGGIGKGYLIDKLASAYNRNFGLKYFIINGGGDIYATSDNDDPIVVTLVHPKDLGQCIGKVKLFNQGFAASSPYIRSWHDVETNKKHNHLHTTNHITTYTVADTACAADVWATTLSIDSKIKPTTINKLILEDLDVIYVDDVFQMNIT